MKNFFFFPITKVASIFLTTITMTEVLLTLSQIGTTTTTTKETQHENVELTYVNGTPLSKSE
jgi:hypothetical protein